MLVQMALYVPKQVLPAHPTVAEPFPMQGTLWAPRGCVPSPLECSLPSVQHQSALVPLVPPTCRTGPPTRPYSRSEASCGHCGILSVSLERKPTVWSLQFAKRWDATNGDAWKVTIS